MYNPAFINCTYTYIQGRNFISIESPYINNDTYLLSIWGTGKNVTCYYTDTSYDNVGILLVIDDKTDKIIDAETWDCTDRNSNDFLKAQTRIIKRYKVQSQLSDTILDTNTYSDKPWWKLF